ncbi:MAG: arginine--tRNA ligase, partial [Gammaproteobacteria bacterium]
MKQEISQLLMQALKRLREQKVLTIADPEAVHIEPARDSRHGDFATNIALVLAKQARMPARELAQAIVETLPESPVLTRVEVAGPGFINFYLAPSALLAV